MEPSDSVPEIRSEQRSDDMKDNYSTVYLRKEFQIDDPAAVQSMVLRAFFDDGVNIWINGTHVAGHNTASADIPLRRGRHRLQPRYDARGFRPQQHFRLLGRRHERHRGSIAQPDPQQQRRVFRCDLVEHFRTPSRPVSRKNSTPSLPKRLRRNFRNSSKLRNSQPPMMT